MYIFKNALTSIVRNKGRNLLIGIIILVIAASSSISLAINSTATDLINEYKSKYETEATLEINRENMMSSFDPNDEDSSKENLQEVFTNASSISEDDINNYGDSDYVKSYYYTMSVGVNSNTLEKASITNNDNGGDFKEGGKNDKKDDINTNSDFTLKGYSSLSAMSEFVSGEYSISTGSVSTDFDSNECLISSELATMNSISVGDEITIVNPNDESLTYTLKVVGIYTESQDDNTGMQMFGDAANTIITNINFVKNISEDDTDLQLSLTPTFILTSSSVVDKFESELRSKGLDENLSVKTNLDEVESALSTISNVKKLRYDISNYNSNNWYYCPTCN